ncbi:MAG: type IV pilin N-terminal domain-containing protein [Methanolinea sp.]|jgi:hypothetical protein|nr:type IV pilin N-terminal domain-containing protein [Methanolinea sp.]
MNHVIHRDEAVSPVVGVMLMLVVTIIIAAIVSGFAGGLAGSQEKVPQASVVATDFVISGVRDLTPGNAFGQGITRPDQGAGNPAADIYVVFQHKGGDAFNLDKVQMQLGKLSEPQVGTLVSRSLTPQAGPEFTTSQGNFGTIGIKSSIPGWSNGWSKYLEKYPDKTSTVITPGESFVLHADYGARSGGSNPTNFIGWLNQGGNYPFPIKQGDVLTYDLIDSNSKKIIASGQILVPEFTVTTT